MGLSLGAQPQRGCDLQPRVAASATLGSEFRNPNRNAVAPVLIPRGNGATAVRLNDFAFLVPG